MQMKYQNVWWCTVLKQWILFCLVLWGASGSDASNGCARHVPRTQGKEIETYKIDLQQGWRLCVLCIYAFDIFCVHTLCPLCMLCCYPLSLCRECVSTQCQKECSACKLRACRSPNLPLAAMSAHAIPWARLLAAARPAVSDLACLACVAAVGLFAALCCSERPRPTTWFKAADGEIWWEWHGDWWRYEIEYRGKVILSIVSNCKSCVAQGR